MCLQKKRMEGVSPEDYALLGQEGFLEFFSADFDGEAHVVTLTP